MNFDLQEYTILLTVAGSRAYGIHRPDSDVDIKGVAIPPRAYRDGFLYNFEQAEGSENLEPFRALLTEEERTSIEGDDLDGVVYEIRKFIKLAADCNPNILNVLFCADEDVRLMTPQGEELRRHRQKFLSKRALHSFSGYAFQQLKRIKGHRRWLMNPPKGKPVRSDFGLPEGRGLVPKKTLNVVEALVRKKIDSWALDLEGVPKSTRIYIYEQLENYLVELELNTEEDRWKAAARSLGVDDDFMALLEKERAFNSAKKQWNQYQSWKKNRNPVRAAMEAESGYDRKHAAHLVRLLRMAREILTEGIVLVRRPDAQLLRDIRNGKWTYDELIEWAEKEKEELKELVLASPLPKRPDRVFLNDLCIELIASME